MHVNEDDLKKSSIEELKIIIQCLRKENFQLREIIDNVPGDVYWKNTSGVWLGINSRGSNSLIKMGFLSDPKEVIGKTDVELFGEETANHFMALDQLVMQEKREISREETATLESGEKLIQISIKRPLYDEVGEVSGIIGNTVDITYLKKIERSLQEAKEQAEASSQAKTEFIANMSHDIRTPLTGVIGMSKMLEDSLEDVHQKQYAQWLGESGNQLLNMLNGVLDSVAAEYVTDIDVHETPFNIQKLVHELLQLERPSTLLKNLDLITTVDEAIPPCLIGDRTKIHRILLNLLSNAIKFTQTGEVTVEVILRDINQTHALIYFSITDTGHGIPKEAQDKVFDRFFKVTPSYKGLYKGQGLGLHIAQTYAKQLGGEIKLISTLGVGTMFYFELSLNIGDASFLITPRAEQDDHNSTLDVSPFHASAVPVTVKTKEIPLNAPHLLLVEDNKIALIMLENLITQSGCRFTSVLDGETAVHLAKTQSFDLIITDLGLPGISGIELTHTLREYEQQQGTTRVPIIGLIAHGAEIIKQECLQAGMNEAYTKPLASNTLYKIKSLYLTQNRSTLNARAMGLNTSGILHDDLPDNEEDMFQLDGFPLLDIDKALIILGHDENMLKTILTSMIEDEIPEDIATLKNAYTAGNWLIIEKLTHRMKGGFMYCGTIRLIYACQYLERYRKTGETQLLDPLYQQFLQVIADTSVAVNEWLSQ